MLFCVSVCVCVRAFYVTLIFGLNDGRTPKGKEKLNFHSFPVASLRFRFVRIGRSVLLNQKKENSKRVS